MWEKTSPFKKFTLFIVSIALLFFMLALASWANPVIDIADPNLEKYLLNRLNFPVGPIHMNDAIRISKIKVRDQQIESLKGLEYFSNLTVLDIENNQVEDISPLAALSHLAELNLRNNKIVDISALENLHNLVYLNLRDNHIQDIKPLEKLNKLEYLNLHSNSRISSLQPLSSLLMLQELILRNVNVADEISVLKGHDALQRVNLRNTNISDINVLSELMSDGALQDNEKNGLKAEVNLLENNGMTSCENNSFSLLKPYWDNITYRYPVSLPNTMSRLSDPVLSQSGGFYEKGFWLELTHKDSDAEIYYTLNGAEPSESSIRYDGPIWIDDRKGDKNLFSLIKTSGHWREPKAEVFKGTVVRALAVIGSAYGHEVISTYFVDPLGADRYSMPVISLVTDERNLFDPDFGIYTAANASNTGYKWERPAHLEFYENDGRLGFSQNIGIRINGGATRKYSQKSLRIYARPEYDADGVIHYEVFPGHTKSGSGELLDKYQTLILRNAGNDWSGAMLRDGFMQSLVDGFDHIETQAYRPAIVFINGEYWGIHNIRERYDADYFANHFDCKQDDFTMLTNDALIMYGNESNRRDYLDLRDFVSEEDMSLQENYEFVKERIDIDSLIQYYSANIYFGNSDWPQNNIDYWRAHAESINDDYLSFDGRWRWLLHDTDYGFGRYEETGNHEFRSRYGSLSGVAFNTLAWAASPANYKYNETWPNVLMNSLLDNVDFRHAFINFMADQLNTIFAENEVEEHLNQIVEIVSPEIEEHINRWQIEGRSIAVWHNEIDEMEEYAKKRPDFVRQHYVGYFKLSGTSNISVNRKHDEGITKINSVNAVGNELGKADTEKWTGIYFQNVAITISAIPNDGYSFVRWEGVDEAISQNQVIEICLTEDIEITPIFEKNERVDN